MPAASRAQGPDSAWRATASEAIVADAGNRYQGAPSETPYQQTSAPATDNTITPTPQAPAGPQPTHAQVTKGSGQLPNDHGQVWREYDITPYTLRVTDTAQPEQAIVDWILRETGYEAWHSSPVGLLSADRKTLRVYYTPQMQAMVADIVDRFVNKQAESHGFGCVSSSRHGLQRCSHRRRCSSNSRCERG